MTPAHSIEKDHAAVMRELDETERRMVDMAVRLVRLEAEIGVYLPSPVPLTEEGKPSSA